MLNQLLDLGKLRYVCYEACRFLASRLDLLDDFVNASFVGRDIVYADVVAILT
jgi:hypothetical protein